MLSPRSGAGGCLCGSTKAMLAGMLQAFPLFLGLLDRLQAGRVKISPPGLLLFAPAARFSASSFRAGVP